MNLRKLILVGGLILIVLGAGQALEIISEILTYRYLFQSDARTTLVYVLLVRCSPSVLLLACGVLSIVRPDIIERFVENRDRGDANQ